jgi:hypothetical protein
VIAAPMLLGAAGAIDRFPPALRFRCSVCPHQTLDSACRRPTQG